MLHLQRSKPKNETDQPKLVKFPGKAPQFSGEEMSNPGEGSHNPPEPPLDIEDPRLVDVIVEDLKSQGVFDKIRAECIGEVDTKVRKSTILAGQVGTNGLVNYVTKTD